MFTEEDIARLQDKWGEYATVTAEEGGVTITLDETKFNKLHVLGLWLKTFVESDDVRVSYTVRVTDISELDWITDIAKAHNVALLATDDPLVYQAVAVHPLSDLDDTQPIELDDLGDAESPL